MFLYEGLIHKKKPLIKVLFDFEFFTIGGSNLYLTFINSAVSQLLISHELVHNLKPDFSWCITHPDQMTSPNPPHQSIWAGRTPLAHFS